jgi:hypothetical protein
MVRGKPAREATMAKAKPTARMRLEMANWKSHGPLINLQAPHESGPERDIAVMGTTERNQQTGPWL